MLDYFLKVLLFQTLFLAVYDLFLKKETFFQGNRAYLIVTSVLAYIIPMLKNREIVTFIPEEYYVQLPEVILTPSSVIKENFDWASLFFNGLNIVFWLGVIATTLLFIIKISKLIRLIKANEKVKYSSYWLVLLDRSAPFSFFSFIFLERNTKPVHKDQIISHELVHVKQGHTFDLFFFEFQKILCWFNPYSYLYQQRIAELHEFIADSIAIKSTDKKIYFQDLLNQSFGTHNISFINLFFKHSLIKKRIYMLNKIKSKALLKLKYLLLLPLLVSMLMYTSCEEGESVQNNKNEKRFSTLYFGDGIKTEKKERKSEKESYFDMYLFGSKPTGKKLGIDELTNEEKLEYEKLKNAFGKAFGQGGSTFNIYEDQNGLRSIEQIIHWDKIKDKNESKDFSDEDEIPFAVIKKAPIWPGCETDDDPKKCTQLHIQDHILSDFDAEIAKSLGLKPGKKKVYVQFTIDKNGNISDPKARGPHKSIEEEAIRVVMNLPKMKPGVSEDGKKVSVKYTLPISFQVD